MLGHTFVSVSISVFPPLSLQWDLEGLEEELDKSKSNLRQMISDSDMVVVKTYGKLVPKKCRLSPDGWFQVWIPEILREWERDTSVMFIFHRWRCSWLTTGSTRSLC